MIRDVLSRRLMVGGPGWRLRWRLGESDFPTSDEVYALTMRAWGSMLDGRQVFTVAEPLPPSKRDDDIFGLGNSRTWQRAQADAKAHGFHTWTAFARTVLGDEDPDVWGWG